MTDKLKTLKDINGFCEVCGYYPAGHNTSKLVAKKQRFLVGRSGCDTFQEKDDVRWFKEELRQEAIKWYHILDDPNYIYSENPITPSMIEAGIVRNFIKHFFNLTEEELKDD